jgi:aminoglycoside phosphotransferase
VVGWLQLGRLGVARRHRDVSAGGSRVGREPTRSLRPWYRQRFVPPMVGWRELGRMGIARWNHYLAAMRRRLGAKQAGHFRKRNRQCRLA